MQDLFAGTTLTEEQDGNVHASDDVGGRVDFLHSGACKDKRVLSIQCEAMRHRFRIRRSLLRHQIEGLLKLFGVERIPENAVRTHAKGVHRDVDLVHGHHGHDTHIRSEALGLRYDIFGRKQGALDQNDVGSEFCCTITKALLHGFGGDQFHLGRSKRTNILQDAWIAVYYQHFSPN